MEIRTMLPEDLSQAAALEAACLAVLEVKEKRGWECIVCKKA